MDKYIEEHTNYAYTLKRIEDISFDKVRIEALNFTRNLPPKLNESLYNSIQRGEAKLQNEPELNMYIHSLGLMHQAKLNYAFNQLSDDFINESVINIIDYGCGQALGTICYADFLREKSFNKQKVRRVILIEPSEIALKRAALHVSCFFSNAEIVTILKDFDDLIQDDLQIDENIPTLHILSNVLDLADDYYNLNDFIKLINNCSTNKDQFVCVEPYFGYDEKDARIQRFAKGLNAEKYYEVAFEKGDFVENKDWTCQIILCRNEKRRSDKNFKEDYDFIELCKFFAQYSRGEYLKFGFEIIKSYDEAVKWFRKAAEQNSAIGQYGLGFCYYKGKGVSQSYDEAVKWFRKAVEQDCAIAQYGLGYCYYKGKGVLQSYEEAVNLFLKAAEQDYVKAQYRLGLCYYEGKGVLQSYKEAVNLFLKAAENGHIKAQCKLGDLYIGEKRRSAVCEALIQIASRYSFDSYSEKHEYPVRNNKEAVKWYKRAAERGSSYAQYRLGEIYYPHITNEFINIESSIEMSFNWYKNSAEQGYAKAQYKLAQFYAKGEYVEQSYLSAIELYRKSANQGYAKAQYELALFYEYGNGVRLSFEEACRWFRKAAIQGDKDAQYQLGVCYDYGKGVEQSFDEAIKWYKKAAEQFCTKALFELGVHYYNGTGVGKSYKTAVKYYNYAATINSDAQYELGNCYRYGHGVKRSYKETVKWYKKACINGNIKAKNVLGEIYNEDAPMKTAWKRFCFFLRIMK